MSGPRFFGLDFETSGTDIEAGAYPIEIGVAVADERYGTIVRVPEHGVNAWSDPAELVHGISADTVTRLGEQLFVAEAKAITWLADFGLFHGKQMDRIAVGWNVASFDVPFLRRWFPNLAAQISYRTVDLNALCFGFEGARHPENGTWSFKRVKEEAKAYAETKYAIRFGEKPRAHRADADAMLALYAFDFLQAEIAGGEG